MRYVNTATAAKAVGMSSRALNRYWHLGRLRPALVTPGGAFRQGRALWDIDDLVAQLQPKELPAHGTDEGRPE